MPWNTSNRFKHESGYSNVIQNVFPTEHTTLAGSALAGSNSNLQFENHDILHLEGHLEVEKNEKNQEMAEFMERTMAENQFVLEASFCAVSELLLEGVNGDFMQWLQMNTTDKIL